MTYEFRIDPCKLCMRTKGKRVVQTQHDALSLIGQWAVMPFQNKSVMSWSAFGPRFKLLFARWSKGGDVAERRELHELEGIRSYMLEMLTLRAGPTPKLELAIHRATDVLSLWHLRCDLMAAVAHCEGEGAARDCVADVTEIFQGKLPESVFGRNHIR